MNDIIIYCEGRMLDHIEEKHTFSYKKDYKTSYLNRYDQLGLVLEKDREALLYYVLDEDTPKDRVRLRYLRQEFPYLHICLCGPVEMACDAWRMDVFYFIKNDLELDRLQFAYKKYVLKLGGEQENYTYREGKLVKNVALRDICYLKAEGNYTHMYLKNDDRVLLSKQMGELIYLCEDYMDLIRVNRSYIINFRTIKSIKSGSIEFFGRDEPVSISKRLSDQIKRYILGKEETSEL